MYSEKAVSPDDAPVGAQPTITVPDWFHPSLVIDIAGIKPSTPEEHAAREAAEQATEWHRRMYPGAGTEPPLA